jgi:anaerobic dimethyl sulfoxide reductase subunit B
MSKEYGIIFIKEKCVQCHGCEVACKAWRSVEPGVQWREVQNIWSGNYPDVKITSVSIACMHCADPDCIKACPEGAITKAEGIGIVQVESKLCSGCKLCYEACQYHVPQFGKDGKMQKCDLCAGKIETGSQNPPCVQTCPTGALVFSQINRDEKISGQDLMLRLIANHTPGL